MLGSQILADILKISTLSIFRGLSEATVKEKAQIDVALIKEQIHVNWKEPWVHNPDISNWLSNVIGFYVLYVCGEKKISVHYACLLLPRQGGITPQNWGHSFTLALSRVLFKMSKLSLKTINTTAKKYQVSIHSK